ncbi:MAG: iron-containing alcohol dehydrogenase [Planctomycetota bacterium]
MRFEFATATRIVFGSGTCEEVPAAAMKMGRRGLLVTGANPRRAQPLREQLAAGGLHVASYGVDAEPTLDTVRDGACRAQQENCDVVIGFGGGSVLDTGKAIAALLTNGGDPLDYLEVIGRGKPLTAPAAPYIAIPTTAGTGAEVTRNAVLASPEHRVKVSLRSPLMLPRLAVVDPRLTHGLPPSITASTGLDALTQLLEPFVSHQANPMTDAFCREGLPRVATSLVPAVQDGGNAAAREDMALASLFGGLALANAKLGAVHGIAGPLGGMFPAPHGATCAALLPHVMAVNMQALGQRQPESEPLRRYQEVARLLTRSETATPADGAAWLEQLCRQLNILPLGSYGLTESHFPDLIEKASRASSMKGNPIALRDEELREILSRAL